ncbi:MAG: hypothetical protein ACE5GZ_14235, partial [Gammaproteobacteria bacterium]
NDGLLFIYQPTDSAEDPFLFCTQEEEMEPIIEVHKIAGSDFEQWSPFMGDAGPKGGGQDVRSKSSRPDK